VRRCRQEALLELIAIALLAAALVVTVLLLGRVTALARGQEDLRLDVQRGREASLLRLAEATQGIRGELSEAQRALAEVKALEQARARQLDQAASSLRRLEAVLAGSATRGAAGENVLARALTQLPPDLLEVNVAFGGKVVEYALRLPGGRLLPIDSKWPSAAALERLDGAGDLSERRRLAEQVGRELRARIREMAKYLDPERTLSLALLAVPDAVYAAAPEALAEGYRDGVLVVPYSLALPYVLALYRLTLRFGGGADTGELCGRLRLVEEALRRSCEEVESRLSRALVQLGNSRDALREQLGEALRATSRLLDSEVAREPREAGLARWS
jgi:DNA recombination protein RmuC